LRRRPLKTGPLELVLTPVDNQRLANLCGTLDENLRQIETALDVTIARRGERFTVRGAQAAQAADVLQKFYDDAKRGLTLDDIQLGLIEVRSRGRAKEDTPLLTRRADLRGRTPRQRQYIQNILEHDITFAIGPAGTGKTYLAVACAVDALERDAVKRIVLVRPAVEAGERLGFLPGDLAQKVDPYLRPLYDALYDVLPQAKVERDLDTGVIEIAPLAFMRGRTLAHSFVILDEAQNTTSMQMKMFLTRIGEGSKMVVTGDPSQIDLPPGQRSGLEEAVGLLTGVRGIEAIRFTSADVVRRDLVARIVDAYDNAG